ncbi:MAG: phosphatase PAP2 family protein [Flammeovirgaceae bacterium]|nr:phosphatase PAP2 family protein [Flammeovirgaceae bacterium]
MLEKILEWDKSLFLFLNGLHTAWLDPVMLLATKTVVWIPLYLLLLFLAIKKFKKDTWIILLAITITITLADQITSGFMKPFFERLRPSHNTDLSSQIHLVDNYKGGLYGFASSHAANTFATAMFFFLVLRSSFSYIGLLFLWAGFMTYTRIYLGVHYPGDILVGSLIGLLCGWGGFKIKSAIENQAAKYTTRKI